MSRRNKGADEITSRRNKGADVITSRRNKGADVITSSLSPSHPRTRLFEKVAFKVGLKWFKMVS